MKTLSNISKIASLLALALAAGACSDDFLKPDPLSFFEPGKTFSTESGLQATLAMTDRHLRVNYIWYNSRDQDSPIGTDYMFSDMMVWGKTDAGNGMNDNFATRVTPTSDGTQNSYIQGGFWGEAYTGIKYANAIVSNLPSVTSLDEATRNDYLGRAYFHRAYRYYNLIFQFGDVPLVTKIISVPKENYYSTKKEAIIKKMIEDLEFAIQWVPKQKDLTMYGTVNNEACRHLLTKYYLAAGRFKDAENMASSLIDGAGLSLMYEPFGTNTTTSQGESQTWKITRNVIWDLHRPENKIGSFNTECILGMPNLSEQSFVEFKSMRIFCPFWNENSTQRFMTPDGKQPIKNLSREDGNYDKTLDWARAIGRGIGVFRPTWFAQHGMWVVNGVEDKEDLRHNSEVGNWINMENLTYNNKDSKYHGQHLQLYAEQDEGNIKKGTLLCVDTIRCWYDFPHYKYYYNDYVGQQNPKSNGLTGVTKGGNGNIYLFRLAETYLLRAEAKLYQGNTTGAAADVNEVRKRAKCSQLYTTVNIGDIMDERGRELWMEEFRNVELTRVSMILAMTGIPDEWGNVYDKDTWDKQDGTDRNGGSYWYQRIMHHSYYNRGFNIAFNGRTLNYVMDKHNLFWPIPNSAIVGNKKGQLKQNYGYDGYNPSVKVWETWEEAVADEDRTE